MEIGTTHTSVSPLQLACELGHDGAARLLIEGGAPVHVSDVNGFTPLHRAAQRGTLEIVQLLLSHHVPVDVETPAGWTPLHYASFYGHLPTATELMAWGARVGTMTGRGITAMYLAQLVRQPDIVNMLRMGVCNSLPCKATLSPASAKQCSGCKIARYCSKDCQKEDWKRRHKQMCSEQPIPKRPSRYSLTLGHIKQLKTYFEQRHAGTDVMSLPKFVFPQLKVPLMTPGLGRVNPCNNHWEHSCRQRAPVLDRSVTVFHRHQHRLKALAASEDVINGGKNTPKIAVNAQDNSQMNATALHIAAATGFDEGVEQLLKFGANPNSVDEQGRTPLHWAIMNAWGEATRLLLDAKADPLKADNSGTTPLRVARVRKLIDCLQALYTSQPRLLDEEA
mmetsp:Transcript_13360/g.28786  ORF Transcript_13360/g.28786 Transcript_13360/m.28786 type:complete len:393 (+) Transcript_13360:1239-2417(+)